MAEILCENQRPWDGVLSFALNEFCNWRDFVGSRNSWGLQRHPTSSNIEPLGALVLYLIFLVFVEEIIVLRSFGIGTNRHIVTWYSSFPYFGFYYYVLWYLSKINIMSIEQLTHRLVLECISWALVAFPFRAFRNYNYAIYIFVFFSRKIIYIYIYIYIYV